MVRFEEVIVGLTNKVVTKVPYVRRQIMQNLGHPKPGFWGRVVVKAMNKHNKFICKETVVLLDVQPEHTFLEVGFGSGHALREALAAGPKRMIGYELSQKMYDEVKNAKDLQDERLELHLGDSLTLNGVDDGSIDRMMMVSTIYFLDPLEDYGREFYRVLAPEGRLFFTVLFPTVRQFDAKVFKNKELDKCVEALKSVGFNVEVKDVPKTKKYVEFQIIICTK